MMSEESVMSASVRAERAKEPVTTGFAVSYVLALFGVWMAIMTPAMVTLALKLDKIDSENKASSYALIAGVGGIIALLANPLFGRLSDRTSTRWGRRRPWMVAGCVGALAGSSILASATTVAMVLVAWSVMQLLCNAAIAALLAVLADRVDPSQRGFVAGLVGITFPAGLLAGAYFVQLAPGNNFVAYFAPTLIGIAFVLLFAVVYSDSERPSPTLPRFSVGEFFGSFYFNPRTNIDFSKMLAGNFLVWIGMAVFQTYMVFFLRDHLGVSSEDVARISFYSLFASNITAMIVSPLTGLVTDKLGRRKPAYALAAVLIACGLIVMVVGSLPIFLVGAGITGFGFGVFKGTYLAMSADTLSNPETTARDLGLVNIAITAPGTIIASVAPLVLLIGGGGNYTLLFVLGALATLSSLLFVIRVRSVA